MQKGCEKTMTDRKSRKVLIINNIKSDTIDQAIFILKGEPSAKNIPLLDTSIASEAQEIIDRYIRQVERLKTPASPKSAPKTKKAKSSSLWPLMFFSVSIISIVLSIMLIFGTS